jgi:hypothetical protein
MRKKPLLALFTLAFLMASVSCKKTTVDTNTQTATDNYLCEGEFMRILPAVNSIAVKTEGDGVKRISSAHYPTVTVTDTVKYPGWPRTMTINYGPGVADSSDGRTRSGIITVSFSNYWHRPGTTATVTYTGYSVNNISYVGGVTLYRNTDTTFTVTVTGAICKTANWNITFGASRVFTWVQGRGDTVAAHSLFSITGTSNGMDRNQVNYTAAVSKALVRSSGCGYITSGTIEITPAGLSKRTVDFGNGNCDNSATVTIDGNSYTLTLQ